MQTQFINEWLANDFTRAFSWMLIHSLWQGLAAAIIAGLIIICTKRSAAGVRYNLLSAVFLLFIAAAIFTFFSKYSFNNPVTSVIETNVSANELSADISVATTPAIQPFYKSFTDNFSKYFEQNAPMVVLAWFMIFMVQCMKLFSGLWYIQTIRRKGTSAPAEEWIQTLKALCIQSGIRQTVQFMQSTMVKMPVVIGYFKPVILVPMGMLTQLPPDQVETILLHELAHIRRKDYLVNLLQSFAETVFFFNPAIKWISGIIRDEREACCDDIVVDITSNKTTYLQALVNFNEHAIHKEGYAMALGSSHTSLLNRVKRMLTYENNKLNIMEKLFLVSGLIVFTAFSIVHTNRTEERSAPVIIESKIIDEPVIIKETSEQVLPSIEKKTEVTEVKNIIPATVIIKEDTVPKKTSSLVRVYTNTNNNGTTKTTEVVYKDENGKSYRVKKLNDKITEMYVNDVRVPDNEIASYETVLADIDAQTKKQTLIAAQRREEAQVRAEQSERMRDKMKLKQEAMADAGRKQQLERSEDMRDREMAMAEKRKAMQETRVEGIRQRNIEMEKRNSDMRRKSTDVSRESNERARQSAELRNDTRAQVAKSRGARNEISSIVNELIKEDIVTDVDNISFTLTDNSLIVNGAKQSAALHSRLKEKFIHKDGDSITYSKSGNSVNTSINRN